MKRALAFFLALLVLCFALPAAGEPAGEDADSLRAFLQEHYGLSIRMGSECYDYALQDYEFTITPEGNTPFQKLLAGNNRFLPLLLLLDDRGIEASSGSASGFRTAKYPDGLLMLLVDGIANEGVTYGGVETTGNGLLEIILSRTGIDEHTIHHELYHAMEVRILAENKHAFDKWRSLNPKGFSYSQKNSALIEEDQFAEPEDWFAREYSKTFEEEDRATVYEDIMTKDEAWWSTRPHLQKKAELTNRTESRSNGRILQTGGRTGLRGPRVRRPQGR